MTLVQATLNVPGRPRPCEGLGAVAASQPRPGARYLFLDFDGVLNSARYFAADRAAERLARTHPAERSADWQAYSGLIDPDAVSVLDDVCLASRCRVVVSSAWRRVWSPGSLAAMLRERGSAVAWQRVVGTTSVDGDLCRGERIARWLGGVRWDGFCVLDDDPSADVVAFRMRSHLVRTTWEDGLTPEIGERAVRVLLGAEEGLS